MKAARLLKSHHRAKKLVETEAKASARREVDHGLRELGRMRRRAAISDEEFALRRDALLKPLVNRPVLGP